MTFYTDARNNASNAVNLVNVAHSENVDTNSASTSAKYDALVRIKAGITSDIVVGATLNGTITNGIRMEKGSVEYFWIPKGYKVATQIGGMSISYFYS